MIDILKRIQLNYKIYTVCQIGIEAELGRSLVELFDFVAFYDYQNAGNLDAYSEINDSNTTQHMPVLENGELIEDFEYLDFKYDIAVVDPKISRNETRKFLNALSRSKTKFIFLPKDKCNNKPSGYGIETLIYDNVIYNLYYLDLISHEISRSLNADKL